MKDRKPKRLSNSPKFRRAFIGTNSDPTLSMGHLDPDAIPVVITGYVDGLAFDELGEPNQFTMVVTDVTPFLHGCAKRPAV